MSAIADVYADDIQRNFKVLYVNWPIGTPLELGDFGRMEGKIFRRLGNIKDRYGLDFKVSIDKQHDQIIYKSANAVDVKFIPCAQGSVGNIGNINASVEIGFAGKYAVFFNAADCSFESIADPLSLGQQIKKLWQDEKWDSSYVLITNIIKAGATIAAVSAAPNAVFALEAVLDTIPMIDLANAGVQLRIKREKNMGLQTISGEGVVPLIGLMKLQSMFIPWELRREEHWETMSRAMGDVEVDEVDLLKEEDEEGSPGDVVYFGQLKYAETEPLPV